MLRALTFVTNNEAFVSDDNTIRNAKAGRKNVFHTREVEKGDKQKKPMLPV